MSKLKIVAALGAVALLAACVQNDGYGQQRRGGINANCAALGAVGGAALGSATDNNIAQSAIVGGVAGALAGNAGMCN